MFVPPQSMLEDMGTGRLAVFTSMCCLMAALIVKRGVKQDDESPVTLNTGDDEFDAVMSAAAKEMFPRLIKGFRDDPPQSLDESIALYRAHLRFNGVQVEEGWLQ